MFCGLSVRDGKPKLQALSLTVLLVDDDSLNIELLSEIMIRLDCKCETASNGADALRTLSGSKLIDLVITDCQMPVMDGSEMVRRMRVQESSTSCIPVVCMSSTHIPGRPRPQACLACGGDQVIYKPITVNVLNWVVGLFLKYQAVGSQGRVETE